MYKHLKATITALIISLLLTGCVAAVVAGAAVAGLVYDRRSVQTIASDTRLFHTIHRNIMTDSRFKHSRIMVTSFNRVVLLVGQVSTLGLKQIAGQIARSTPGVERVYNELSLCPLTSFSQRSEDTWITSQVRAVMLARKDLESGSIRIVTERGTVYLMGIATLQQSNLAVDVARRINGVNKVVKIFKYIH